MTFAELRTATFRDLDENEGSPVFFALADVDDALNDGYRELSDETEWYERSVLIKLLRQQRHYDLRTLTPDEVLSLGPAYNRTTSRWLESMTITDLDQQFTRWENVDGQPTAVFQRGLWTFGYWPMVALSVGTVQQYYTAMPPALSLATDVPGFPARWHRALVDYATSELWIQKGETTKAMSAWARYLEGEQGVLDFVESRASIPMVRVMGETG